MELKNFFFNDEFVEMAKKNVDFTMDLYKQNVQYTEGIMRQKMDEYFGIVNSNIEFITRNYQTAVKTNTEIAENYKKNAEKTYELAKKMMENIKQA